MAAVPNTFTPPFVDAVAAQTAKVSALPSFGTLLGPL